MGLLKDESGNKYGRLTVQSYYGLRTKRAHWVCRCDCGTVIVASGKNLRNGNTKSCGCLQREIAASQLKDLHPNWKGGRLMRQGYVLLLKPGHPRSDKKGYIKEHIFVMGIMLGYDVPPSAEVHHCNGDRSDNRPYNLRLFASKKDHITYHRKLTKEMKPCQKPQE